MRQQDLNATARRIVAAAGFPTAFRHAEEVTTAAIDTVATDLRGLVWSSIDNAESRDLDQVEAAEAHPDGTVRVMVGIADVDAYVPKGSPLDLAAAERMTSVYTGAGNFPMLPESLSENLTSLLPTEDRPAVITELIVGPDGGVLDRSVYRATLRNRAKLAYETTGAWLEDGGAMPSEAASTPGLEVQLRIQDIVSAQLRTVRQAAGALDFETIEARPVIENGRIVGLTVPRRSRARFLIENFMIAANTAVSGFLQAHGFPSIQRIVRRPQRWDRIVDIARTAGDDLPPTPDAVALAGFLARRRKADPTHFADLSLSIVKLLGPGEYAVVAAGDDLGEHFGLAVYGYTHSTAPNRRYVDLITQRLLKAACCGAPCPYSVDDLRAIADRANERAQAARKIERTMRKIIAAVMMQPHIGETFAAIVTGAKPSGTYVRVLNPPVEGRVMRGERGLDVGDRVNVKLIGVDTEAGFVDFERV
jgi:exoribonuclease-2